MNKLITWNPLQEMEEAQNRFSTLFGGFPTFPIRFPKNGGSLKLADLAPLVGITPGDHEYLFQADLPEMEKEDGKRTIQNGNPYHFRERRAEQEAQKRK